MQMFQGLGYWNQWGSRCYQQATRPTRLRPPQGVPLAAAEAFFADTVWPWHVRWALPRAAPAGCDGPGWAAGGAAGEGPRVLALPVEAAAGARQVQAGSLPLASTQVPSALR